MRKDSLLDEDLKAAFDPSVWREHGDPLLPPLGKGPLDGLPSCVVAGLLPGPEPEGIAIVGPPGTDRAFLRARDVIGQCQ